MRATMRDDYLFHDHRRTGPGRLEGRDGYLAWIATLFERSSDAIIEPLYYVATGAHGHVAVGHTLGTHDGGEFESVFVQVVFYRDDRRAGAELFELDDLDAALARYEALRTEAAA